MRQHVNIENSILEDYDEKKLSKWIKAIGVSRIIWCAITLFAFFYFFLHLEFGLFEDEMLKFFILLAPIFIYYIFQSKHEYSRSLKSEKLKLLKLYSVFVCGLDLISTTHSANFSTLLNSHSYFAFILHLIFYVLLYFNSFVDACYLVRWLIQMNKNELNKLLFFPL